MIFTCGRCGIQVSQARHNRNACPYCHWSKHVMYGDEVGCPPCGSMMKPVRFPTPAICVWYCLGCRFQIKGPTEKELKRIRRTEGKVSWRTGIQGDVFRHHITECIKISACLPNTGRDSSTASSSVRSSDSGG